MLSQIKTLFSGAGIRARALRGSGLTFLSFGGANALRLISNLILTRLLFPEAFGLMAIVQVVMSGLEMFSDTGINTSIMQNKRGDEAGFLNTAWTVQIIRGFILWGIVCLLAAPVATLYNAPLLTQLLPVAGLTVIISGFTSTKVATSQRHMTIGRLTSIDLSVQTLSIFIMALAAYILDSVWALVIGALLAATARVILAHLLLPGITNRLHWDPAILRELLSFGKYLFLSTFAGFILNEGNRVILGVYVTVAELGVFNVGLLLGAIPLVLSRAVAAKVLLPLYRIKPSDQSAQNRAQIFKARRLLILVTLLFSSVSAFCGIALVDSLYDPRYALAGPLVVLMSFAIVPQIIFTGYGQILLAYGNSKQFFLTLFLAAVLQTLFLFVAITFLGMFGAVIAVGLASLFVYPFWVIAVRPYKAWDARADFAFLAFGLLVNGSACWLQRDAILLLLG